MATLYDERCCLKFMRTVVPIDSAYSDNFTSSSLLLLLCIPGMRLYQRSRWLISSKLLSENFFIWCSSKDYCENILQSIQETGSFVPYGKVSDGVNQRCIKTYTWPVGCIFWVFRVNPPILCLRTTTKVKLS